jgi:hypothetical protein
MNASSFTPVSSVELMAAEMPSRADLLPPLISGDGSLLVYGAAGVGKTFFALGIARAAAAGGSFLGWRAPRAHRVVYVDGELGADEMRARLALLGGPLPHLQFFLPDRKKGPLLDLTRVDAQHRLMEQWGDPELVIFDSLASLAALRSGDDSRWEQLQHFLQRQKTYGRAIVVVHHANQQGRLHGSAQRANTFDAVLALQRPATWRPSDGACFEIHVEKTRRLMSDAERVQAQLGTDPDGKARWRWASMAGSRLERAAALLNRGWKVKAMGDALGVKLATAYRLRNRADQRGLLHALTLTETADA